MVAKASDCWVQGPKFESSLSRLLTPLRWEVGMLVFSGYLRVWLLGIGRLSSVWALELLNSLKCSDSVVGGDSSEILGNADDTFQSYYSECWEENSVICWVKFTTPARTFWGLRLGGKKRCTIWKWMQQVYTSMSLLF